ncbi:MAG: hypothetical protein M1827_000934 [Pycnora praestabilis]|nr:MAG: hypothetical protein M1827_000934 [Pycnora praestabilis]
MLLRHLALRLISISSAPTRSAITAKSFSTILRRSRDASSTEPITASLNPRWLSDLKRRIGKCILFGLKQNQSEEAGLILQVMAKDWRDLVAGSEGFLTSKGRRGLYRQQVVWGEMPMTWPDHITVYHKLRSLPSSSTDCFILDVVILSELHQRPAARCVEDIVVYDYKQGNRTPLRPFMVEKFRETFELQERAKIEYSDRVKVLFDRVETLESASWNREDAKEDLGTA